MLAFAGLHFSLKIKINLILFLFDVYNLLLFVTIDFIFDALRLIFQFTLLNLLVCLHNN